MIKIKRTIQNKLIIMVVSMLSLLTLWDILALNLMFGDQLRGLVNLRMQFVLLLLQLILGCVIGILFAVLIARMITKPLRQLSKGAEEISEKDNLDVQFDISTGDEIELLAQTFNRMVKNLKEARMEDKAANPLTSLPGNIMLMKEIELRIREKSKFSVLYIDLSNFKMFNDKYGFERGDEVITQTAQTIADVVSEYGRGVDFIGHIGGDDFMVITVPEREEKISSEIAARFDAVIPMYYSREDVKAGFISIVNKEGEEERAPIMTVAIAIVNNSERDITHHGQVTQLTANVKIKAKALGKSGFAR
jgi:diguanylate cyclase (GGDEF)-like protein